MTKLSSVRLSMLTYLAKVHREKDGYRTLIYWDEETGKGCTIGSTLRFCSNLGLISLLAEDYDSLENPCECLAKIYGLPVSAVCLIDLLFERLEEPQLSSWTVLWHRALTPGVEYNEILYRLLMRIRKYFRLEGLNAKRFQDVTQAESEKIRNFIADRETNSLAETQKLTKKIVDTFVKYTVSQTQKTEEEVAWILSKIFLRVLRTYRNELKYKVTDCK